MKSALWPATDRLLRRYAMERQRDGADDEGVTVVERLGDIDPAYELVDIGRELALTPSQAAKLLRSSVHRLSALAA
jgi:hypothetical protein